MKIIISIIFMFVSSGHLSANEEIWECFLYEGSKDIRWVFKLNTDEPSVAMRKAGRWEYYKGIVYDKENTSLSESREDSSMNQVFDLVVKEIFIEGIQSTKCNVLKK